MSDKPNTQKPGLPLQLPDDLAPQYTNVARISHTPSDFVMDFARALPGQPNAPVVSRLVMSPLGAKLFLRALADNVTRFEALYGEIVIPAGDAGLANDLFRRVQPPDAGE